MLRGMRSVLMFPLTRIILAVFIIALAAAAVFVPAGLLGFDLPSAFDGAVLLGATGLALFVLARFIERRPLAQVGLSSHRAVAHAAAGFGFGALLMTVTVSVLAAAGWYRVEGVASQTAGAAALQFLNTFCGIALFAAFEELAFRGIVFRVLEESLGTSLSLTISAVVFGFAHAQNPGATMFSSIAIAFEAGILLGVAFVLTRSVWFATGIHAGWNFFLGYGSGVAVSGTTIPSPLRAKLEGPELWTGGAFGPEASLITLTLCTVAGALMLLAAWRRGLLVRIWFLREAPGVVATGAPEAGDLR